MKRLQAISAGVALLFSSCRDASNASVQQGAKVSQSTAERAHVPTTAPRVAPLWWQDSTCEMDTTLSHLHPGELVKEYLKRSDSLGFGVGNRENEQWLTAADECPGHRGVTDGITVVLRYQVDSVSTTADSAVFAVRYQMAGDAEPDADSVAHWHFRTNPYEARVTLVLIHTPFGWRITGPLGDALLSPAAVLRRFHFVDADRRTLDSLAGLAKTP